MITPYNSLVFTKLAKFFTNEVDCYRALSTDLRKLLLSYYFYLAAYPMFGLFTNAYLWRQNGDLKQLIVFNLFYCIGLPSGFYINGLLLRRFSALRLYALGAFMEALASLLVVFFHSGTFGSLVWYGLLAGLGSGLFWGNKNFLSLKLTRGENRLYYNTLESAGDLMANMIVPALAGLFIVVGGQIAYKILMGVGMILVVVAGYVIQSSKVEELNREPMFVRNPKRIWNSVRWFNILSNILVGAESIIPGVLILLLVGKEGTLGIVNSATAILSALSIYTVGRMGKIENLWKIVGVADFMYMIGVILLAWFFNPIVVLVYSAVSTIAWTFRWSPSSTLTMEIMDEGDGDQYAYICDTETMFNIGRITGLVLLFGMMSFGQNAAMRFVPVAIGLTSFLALWPLVKMTRHVVK